LFPQIISQYTLCKSIIKCATVNQPPTERLYTDPVFLEWGYSGTLMMPKCLGCVAKKEHCYVAFKWEYWVWWVDRNIFLSLMGNLMGEI